MEKLSKTCERAEKVYLEVRADPNRPARYYAVKLQLSQGFVMDILARMSEAGLVGFVQRSDCRIWYAKKGTWDAKAFQVAKDAHKALLKTKLEGLKAFAEEEAKFSKEVVESAKRKVDLNSLSLMEAMYIHRELSKFLK